MDYRLYRLSRDGRIVRGEVVQCADDAEAVAFASQLTAEGGHAVELWHRSRRVATFPCREHPLTGSGGGPSAASAAST